MLSWPVDACIRLFTLRCSTFLHERKKSLLVPHSAVDDRSERQAL